MSSPHSFAQSELPQFFTLDGRLFEAGSATEPLLDGSVVMTVQILNPAKTCILYEETETVSTLATNGFFTARIGSATGAPERASRDSNNSMTTVFVNASAPITGKTSGGGACSYTPAAGDVREFRFFITPSTVGSTAQLSDDMTVDSVPQALVSQTLRGLGPSNFFQTSATSTQAKLDNLLTTNYSTLSDVISGTSSLYLQNSAVGTQLPTRATDPSSPAPGQMWYDTATNEVKYFNGTTIEAVGSSGGGVTSVTAGAGLSGGTISTTGTIAIDTGGVATGMIANSAVTDAKLASGIDAAKITVGTLPAGVVPSGTDTTKLPLDGSVAMSGALDLGANNLLNTGHITMNSQRTITIGRYDAGQQTTLIGTLGAPNAGASWYNTTTGKLMYWNGSAALELSESTTGGGDITAINTNAGSGLTGGVTSGPASLAVNVDGTTLEVATNTVQVKDAGIDANKLAAGAVTNGKLAADAVTSDKILNGEITDADINAAAAIAWSKIDKTGATASDVGAVPTSRQVNTNAGSGLAGGGDLTANRNLSINVDDATIEIATNTVQLKDGGVATAKIANSAVTDAKIDTVSVNKITSAIGQYFTYAPNGGACAPGEVLKKTVNGWECGTDATGAGVTDHGALTGLGDDDHTQYVMLAGRAGGQNLRGGTASGEDLTLESTSNATKGDVLIQPTDGNVGIGTTAPTVKLDVEGTIQIGDGGETCTIGANAGMVKYAAGALQYCNGSAWQTLGVSGAGLTTLNAQTGSTQTFAAGVSGLAPGWSSAANIHTFNIPLASGAGVTSGTISKVDYDAFTAKLSSVTGSALTSARLWVGDGTNLAQPVLMSGDATMSNTGVVTIANDAITTAKIDDDAVTTAKIAADAVTSAKIDDDTITNADINSAAAIAWTKIDKTGATAADVGAVPTARNINTNAGSGLTGGGNLSADRSLSLNVDGSTIEIATNTVQVKDGGITTAKIANSAVTDAKIDTVSVNKITSALGQYFTYAPNGGACAPGEVLKKTVNGWECGTDATGGGVTDHGALTGLGDDDHTQYVMLAGRSGGQNLRGGTASGENLTLESTSNATKGDVLIQPTDGNVGIGTTAPDVKLDVEGTIQIGDGGETCTIGANAGMVKYAAGALQYCNGSAWQTLGVSGAGLTTLNAQTGSTQTFAVGVSGLAPGWSSAANVHTINIPLASGAGVTSGTISKVDYDAFTAKLSAVTGSALTSARLWVGDGTNLAQPVLMSGDATMSNTGAVTIANDAITTAKIDDDAVTSAKIDDDTITNADINSAAAIAWTKIDKAGATAADVGAVPTARNINTNAGSGLTGGGNLSADRSLALNVDGSTIEIATNTVQVKDGGIATAKIANSAVTDAKIDTVSVNKIASALGQYFTYAPNGGACANGEVLKKTINGWECGTDATGGGVTDHGALTGLGDDDHTQYVMLAGRAGGQNLRGGTASGEDLTLESTSNATKGDVLIQPTDGNVGIGTTAPDVKLDVEGTIQIGDGGETCTIGANAGMVKYAAGALQYCNGSAWQTLGVSGAGLTTLNAQTGSTQTFATGATGLAPAWNSATNVHTLNIPLASGAGVTSGTISKVDYDAFTAKLSTVTGSALTSARLWVGDGSNLAQPVLMSGDATMSNTGAVTIANNAITSAKINDGAIVNADINASAAIAWTKIDKTGAVAADVGAVATTRNINTNAGSGLTGGGNLSADRSLALNVDGSTIEIATNTVQVKDSGITTAKIANSAITDAKIDTMSVNKVTSALGQYFTYAPNGGACANGEVLKKTINGWECGVDAGGVTDHGALTGLLDDDHTQYVMLAGRAGGQNLRGGTAASNNLTLESTSNATKGFVVLQPTGGNVGIGTTTPTTRLDVEGTIQLGDGGETCSIAANAGMVKYAAGALQYCNGSAWQTLGVSGAGLTTLNAQTGSTQTFATGATGLAPAWSSATNVHTLNIPLASGAGVTSGTISKVDYDAFTAKLSAVTGSALTSARLWVGDGSNLAQPVLLSGDATMSNTGAVTIANNAITSAKISDGAIVNADINAAAAIAWTKIDKTGAVAADVGAVATTRAINTNAGSGLTGGGNLTADRNIALNVDNTTIEIATNTVQVKDLGISTAKLANGAVTDAKIGTVSVNKITSALGQYFTYAPNGGACANGEVLKKTINGWECGVDAGGVTDHGALTGLLDDDHTQYVMLAGRAGGQNLRGGTASGDDLTLESTSNATKGDIFIQPNGGSIGIGTTGPLSGKLQILDTDVGNRNQAVLIQNASNTTGSSASIGFSASAADMNVFMPGEIGFMRGSSTADTGMYIGAGTTGTQPTMHFLVNQVGNVGIGTTAPTTKLDVEGTLQVGDGGETCSIAANAGMVKYAAGALQYCNGSAWQTLGVSGAGLTTLNAQTGSTQTFATGATGLAPAWSSATNVHTLNIPLASGAGVTSGTISKVDYDAFTAKLSAVTGSALTSARLWVGDGSNLAQPVLLSGDATMSNTGAVTIANNAITSAKINDGAIVNADINAAAAIAWTKIDKTGAVAADVGAVATTRAINTNAGSGLTGGGNLTADRNIAMNVDNTTIEIATNTVQVKDLGISTAKLANGAVTDAKIGTMSVNKVTSALGQYFTYAPNGGACANGEVLKKTINGWECGVDAGGVTDHGALTGLLDDDHTQYVMLAGRAGGQNLRGGTAASNNLTLESTSNATKGFVVLQPTGGNVGIGTTTPTTRLDVEGTIQIGDGGETCSIAANAGMVKYVTGTLQYCNGSSWQTLGVSGSGLTTLNSQTGSTQTFATGSTGTAPAWSSAANVHTLNIPLASGAGVTSGTITKAQYDSFVAKLSAVTGSALTSARLWVGDGSNLAQPVLLSGDVTMSNTGAVTIANNAITSAKINDGAIVNADINAAAAIAWTKIDKTGAVAADVGAVATTRAINTNAGSGLTGGGNLTADRNIAMNVDNTTIEIATNTVQVKDLGISTAKLANSAVTDAKIGTVSVNKVTSALGQYFTYAPNGGACANGEVLKKTINGWECGVDTGGVTDHGALTGLLDDDHTQYVMLAGRAGGQNLRGGTAASNNLTLESTSNVTKGHVLVQPNGGNVGIGTTTPAVKLQVQQGEIALVNDDNWGAIYHMQHSDTKFADISVRRSRGTQALPTFVQANDRIGQFSFFNHSHTGGLATMSAVATQTHTTAVAGTKLQFETTPNGSETAAIRMTIGDGGNVGIGTETPATKLDVEGTIQIGDGGETCSIAANAGMVKYVTGTLQYCNGSSWQTLGVSGSGLTTLNSQTGSTQTFATGATGLAPAWSSAANVHTLNIPLASGAGVTSGTITKAQYDSFVAKLSAVTGSALTSARLWVGDGSNLAQPVLLSGDVTMSNTGAVTIANNAITSAKISDGAIVNADINAAAAIAWTKIDKTGAVAADVGAVATTRAINTNAGSGLTGGGNLTADRNIAMNVDNTTIEIATNTVQVKDLGISTAKIANGAVTDAKIGTMSVNKVSSALGQYFTYAPNGGACANGEVLKKTINGWECGVDTGGVTDHGALTGLLDDDHTQYVMLAGRAGGQNLRGGTAASNNLTLESTSNATKGFVVIQPTGGNVGIGTTAPATKLQVEGSIRSSDASPSFSFYEGDQIAGERNWFSGVNGKQYVLFQGRSDDGSSGGGDTLTVDRGVGNAMIALNANRNAVSFFNLNYATGNVGIGTTAPSFPLHIIKDDGVVDGEHTLFSSSRVTGSAGALVMGYRADGASVTGAFLRQGGGVGPLDLGTASTPQAVRIGAGGLVGIGTTTPATRLDVEGTIQIGDGGETCTIAANAGMVKYVTGTLQYCNGSAWQTLGISGSGLTTLNSQTGSTQTFATGSTGTAPAWSSAANVHTLNIPLASGAGVTSGTITKAQYDSFVAKLSAVTGSALTSARLWVGDGSNLAQPVLLSGDVTMSNTGAVTIANNAITSAKISDGAIVNADINAAAAIAWTKIDKTGAVAADVGAVATTRAINTNAGSGLTGGGNLTADRNIAMNVDNTTIEIATNTVQVKDLGISTAKIANSAVTDAKIGTVSVNKVTSALGQYFTYAPNGGACANGEVLKKTVNGWECGTDSGSSDHGTLAGLADDDHTQYAMLAGRAGGQNLRGGTAASNNLTLESTSNATKGFVVIQPTAGNVGVGTTTPSGKFHVSDSDSSTILTVDNRTSTVARYPAVRIANHGNSFGGAPTFYFNQSEGTSAVPSAVAANATTGQFIFQAYDGTVQRDVARIYGGTGPGFNGTDQEGFLAFITGDAATYNERMRINHLGNVGIGTSVPVTSLHVSKSDVTAYAANSATWQQTTIPTLKVQNSANDNNASSQILLANRSTITERGTRLVNVGSGSGSNLAIVTGQAGAEAERMRIDHAGNVGIGTSVPAVSLDFNTRTDAIRLPAGTTAQQPTAANGMIRYNTTNNKFEGYENGAWVNLRDIASGGVLAGGAGSVGAPSLSFTGDPNTGLYSNGADVIGIAANGVNIFNLSSAGLVSPTTGGALVTTANGTAATPTYSFAGDPDTGWWRPAADTMAASTNGVERVRITSSGYVGLGTTVPSTRLHVEGPSVANSSITLNNTSTAPNISDISFLGQGFSYAQIAGHSTTADSGFLRFHTSTGGVQSERLRITETGNVGIGTSTPSETLDVIGRILSSNVSTDATIKQGLFGSKHYTNAEEPFFGLQAYSTATTNTLWLGGGTTGGNAATDIRFNTAANNTTLSGTERMVITSAGDVGIGTTVPGARFNVVDTNTTTAGTVYNTANYLYAAPATASTGANYAGYNLASTTGAGVNNITTIAASYSRAQHAATGVVTNSYGADSRAENASTGTISNARGALNYALNSSTGTMTTAHGAYNYAHNSGGGAMPTAYGTFSIVNNASGTVTDSYAVYARAYGAGTTTNSYGVYIGDQAGTNQWGIYQLGATDTNYFAGDTGIGTTAPVSKLDVSGTTGSVLTLSRADTAATAAESIGKIQFWNNDAQLTTQNIYGDIEMVAAQGIATDAAAGNMIFRTTATTVAGGPQERMRISTNGNVGIGTTNPGVKLQVEGTVQADAYVEGAGAAASSTATYTIPDITKGVRRITLTANTTITLPLITSLPADTALSLTVRVTQDATGNRTITWAGNGNTIKWDQGAPVAPASGANQVSIYQFLIVGGETTWYASKVWSEQ